MVYKRISVTSQNQNNIIQAVKNEKAEEEALVKYDEMMKMLIKGEVFTKYAKFGDPHLRQIFVLPDLSKIVWKVTSGCNIFTPLKEMEIDDVILLFYILDIGCICWNYKL